MAESRSVIGAASGWVRVESTAEGHENKYSISFLKIVFFLEFIDLYLKGNVDKGAAEIT